MKRERNRKEKNGEGKRARRVKRKWKIYDKSEKGRKSFITKNEKKTENEKETETENKKKKKNLRKRQKQRIREHKQQKAKEDKTGKERRIDLRTRKWREIFFVSKARGGLLSVSISSSFSLSFLPLACA